MSHEQDVAILSALEGKNAQAKAFRALSRRYWGEGALSSRDKHIVAVGVAQVTRCEYCIEHHARIARQLGATRDQLLAAAYITAALETLLGDTIGIDADSTLRPQRSALSAMPIEQDRNAFVNQVFQEGTLPLPLRYVIAASAALAKEHEGQRQAFHHAALAAGVPPAALEEGYAIGVILKAGAVYAHTLGIARAFA
ncbi:carboxymuconolactone decarboxylase family protein [Acerihabitans sp.]|uniref:carboxymuconolactone decarboxylase family protein n=1 Tax=Acerihabitans sp. TaxID=2811394 RepID=UPI002EDA646D